MVTGGVREHRVWDVSTRESARWARVEKLADAVRAYLNGKDGTNVEVCGSEEDVRDVVGALKVPNVTATRRGKRAGNWLDVEVVVKQEGAEVAKFGGSVEVVRCGRCSAGTRNCVGWGPWSERAVGGPEPGCAESEEWGFNQEGGKRGGAGCSKRWGGGVVSLRIRQGELQEVGEDVRGCEYRGAGEAAA